MNTVTGRFETRDGADRAVSSLIHAGFEREEISISNLGDPLFRQDGLSDQACLSERRSEIVRHAVTLLCALLGAALGAMLLPLALSLEASLRPTGAAAIAMGVGALIAFVFASRVASLLVADAELAPRHARIGASPTIVGVRTLDAFARRAARILTRAGGASIASESF